MQTLNVKDLVASITRENESATPAIEKVASVGTLADKLALAAAPKDVTELEKVANEIAAEVGLPALDMSAQLEKVATEMEAATTSEDIIKIAQSLDNTDLAHLHTIAAKLADVVVDQINQKLN